ncbi:MAG TPA: OmpA family protein [Flavobacterium sp.]|jgi:chemotaxis protein MotB|uniref:OmpA family protein n=1 Tax=Flavobacterium sp. TaxID=239 RepID=UPI0025BEE668|nr:OmpA family protein [Flavobacterium sp.]MBA4153133.1 cell envelope biogenesis protein OmpA [Flavobacterium sp.]HRZ75372.1 OmpA family protein [Flavobacterium sp.]HRZ75606.1 OmpA family protein [Flavobacterium sp.]
MIKKVSLLVLVAALATSCVSKKVYNELESKFAALKKEQRQLSDENHDLEKTKNKLEVDLKANQDELARIKAERDKLQNELATASTNLKTLTASYTALEKNSDEALQANMQKNRELLAQLDAKEKALLAEQERLNKLQADLKERSQRVTDLENLISSKEESMRKLKETLSKALNSFEGKGLTVEQKNGKVYVSMENKLLFQTGSWAVGTEGKRAVVEVGKVLAQNPDISVLIEGHTDNDKILGSIGGGIENNWDLSTKRATAIVNILAENKGINKQNLTAAGRGEFAPLMSNDSPEGKAKNRRIEIILTPKLDEISKMLNDL